MIRCKYLTSYLCRTCVPTQFVRCWIKALAAKASALEPTLMQWCRQVATDLCGSPHLYKIVVDTYLATQGGIKFTTRARTEAWEDGVCSLQSLSKIAEKLSLVIFAMVMTIAARCSQSRSLNLHAYSCHKSTAATRNTLAVPFGSVGIASQHFPIFTSTKRLCFHDSREYCLHDFHETVESGTWVKVIIRIRNF